MSFVSRHCSPAVIALTLLASVSSTAAQAQSAPAPVSADDQARTIADLQRQIDELKAIVTALQTAQSAPAAPPPPAMAAPAPQMAQAEPQAAPSAPASVPEGNPSFAAAAAPAPKSKAWYEKLRLRGYTQMRFSQIVSGDAEAPAGVSRLRSIHDSAVNADSNFSFRRLRMVIQGDLNDHVSLYFQPDFAAAVSNQSVGERREGTVSLRDMYADVFPFDDKSFRIRLGQSKVPYGWENMQSSSNRLALDRTDAINSAAPGERDLGIVAYYPAARPGDLGPAGR